MVDRLAIGQGQDMAASEFRVLLLENNPDDVGLLQGYLAQISATEFTVVVFKTLAATMTYLADHNVDVVVTNLDLPDSQGLDTLVRLRAEAPDLPVIALTGLYDEQVRIKAVNLGAQAYLIKDELSPVIMCREISCALQHFQMAQELRRHRDHLEELVNDRTAALRQEIEQRKLAEASEREQRTLAETLRQTITNLTSYLEIDQVMEQILANIGAVVPHDTANIMLIEGAEARVAYWRGYTAEQEQRIRTYRCPLDINTLHQIMITGRPYLVEDTTHDSDWIPSPDLVRCYLGVPINVQNQVIGFINLNSATPGFFTAEHIERLIIFAEQAAIAVQNAQLFSEIARYASAMTRLQRANGLLFSSMSTSHGLAEFGRQVAETAVKTFDLVDCGIILINDETGDFERLARAGQHEAAVLLPLQLDGPGLVPEAVRRETTIYVPDVTKDSRYVANIDSTRSELVIPLRMTGNKIIGVIDLQSSEVNAFTLQDRETLRAYADRAAIAIENMQLNDALRLYTTGMEERMVERTAQLERLNQRMSVVLNNISDSIILTDADGIIDITNPAFNQRFGYLPDDLFGHPLTAICDPTYHERLEALRQSALAEGSTQLAEILARCKDETTFEAEITLSKVKNTERQLVCNIHDISRLKAVERMKDEFISTVSHELRTPITAITLLTTALNDYYDRMTEDQIIKRVEQLHTQSNVLAELVESVLDISKMEMREENPTRAHINMNTVVSAIVSELQSSALAKQQTIDLTVNETPAIIPGEAMDFARIWRNLINNAVKYTPEGGRISVRVHLFRKNDGTVLAQSNITNQAKLLTILGGAQHDYVIGQVEDTGYGIEPDDFDGLFKRFDRGWAKDSNIPGTGLGLSLVRELLTFYGGDIDVTSEVNHGSTFTFWLPINKGD